MISTDTTRWIIRKLDDQAAAEAALQARLDAQNRFEAARASYTSAELVELLLLARIEHDETLGWDLAWQLTAQDPSWVILHGWNWGGVNATKRPRQVPAEVRVITGCTCDGGTCCYCTCCELWNGEHSCEYGRRNDSPFFV